MKFLQLVLSLSGAALTIAGGPGPSCSAATSSLAALTCGASCVTSAASAVGCTVLTDFACECSSSASSAIQSRAFDCVLEACGTATGLQVEAAAQAICTACV